MSLRDALVAALTDLDSLNVPYAVIGGLAVSARVEPRMTRDVDVSVAVSSDAEAEAVIHSLFQRHYSIVGVLEQSAAGRLATIRLKPPISADSGELLDLLFASSGIEQEVTASAQKLSILRGVVAPIATVGHLIALKLLSQGAHRPQDAIDLVALASAAQADDWGQAQTAVGLISQRGFSRGRDLATSLRELKQDHDARAAK